MPRAAGCSKIGAGAARDQKFRGRVCRSVEYLRQTSQSDPMATRTRSDGRGGASGNSGPWASSTMCLSSVQHSRRPSLVARYHGTPRPVFSEWGSGSLTNEMKHPHDFRRLRKGTKKGRLMLIIDVQSKRGAVEEVHVRDGDSAYLLAKGFVVRQVKCAGIYVRPLSSCSSQKTTSVDVRCSQMCLPPQCEFSQS